MSPFVHYFWKKCTLNVLYTDGFHILEVRYVSHVKSKREETCSEQCGQDWNLVSSPWDPGPFHVSGGGCADTTDSKASRN